eukprot:Pgem_evm1s14289
MHLAVIFALILSISPSHAKHSPNYFKTHTSKKIHVQHHNPKPLDNKKNNKHHHNKHHHNKQQLKLNNINSIEPPSSQPNMVSALSINDDGTVDVLNELLCTVSGIVCPTEKSFFTSNTCCNDNSCTTLCSVDLCCQKVNPGNPDLVTSTTSSEPSLPIVDIPATTTIVSSSTSLTNRTQTDIPVSTTSPEPSSPVLIIPTTTTTSSSTTLTKPSVTPVLTTSTTRAQISAVPSSSDNNDSSFPLGAIIGAAVGGVVLVVGIFVIAFFLVKWKRKKTDSKETAAKVAAWRKQQNTVMEVTVGSGVFQNDTVRTNATLDTYDVQSRKTKFTHCANCNKSPDGDITPQRKKSVSTTEFLLNIALVVVNSDSNND